MRRLAVTDAAGKPIGILSINDISRKAPAKDKPKAAVFEEFTHTLAAIGQPNGKPAPAPSPAAARR